MRFELERLCWLIYKKRRLEIFSVGNETVDRNYWSDYFAKYPNATEIDSLGVGDTPYVFVTY